VAPGASSGGPFLVAAFGCPALSGRLSSHLFRPCSRCRAFWLLHRSAGRQCRPALVVSSGGARRATILPATLPVYAHPCLPAVRTGAPSHEDPWSGAVRPSALRVFFVPRPYGRTRARMGTVVTLGPLPLEVSAPVPPSPSCISWTCVVLQLMCVLAYALCTPRGVPLVVRRVCRSAGSWRFGAPSFQPGARAPPSLDPIFLENPFQFPWPIRASPVTAPSADWPVVLLVCAPTAWGDAFVQARPVLACIAARCRHWSFLVPPFFLHRSACPRSCFQFRALGVFLTALRTGRSAVGCADAPRSMASDMALRAAVADPECALAGYVNVTYPVGLFDQGWLRDLCRRAVLSAGSGRGASRFPTRGHFVLVR